MRTSKRLILLILLFMLPAGLVACRRDRGNETPTVTATTVASPQSATATRPAPTPTMIPTPVTAIDPADIDWAPQVIYSSPEPGQEALLDGAITIRFDQAMDQASVESAFNIQGAADGLKVSGVFEWPRPDTLVFTPGQHLSRQQRYEVSIEPQATGRNGQKLEAPINLSFETVGFLEVSQIIPAGGLTNISTDSSITVMFNRPVVPLVTTDQQADLLQPLLIEPTLAGHGEWVSTSIYRFTPDPSLTGATTYTVRVPAGLSDTTGGLLASDYSWSFTTEGPSVATIIPEIGASDIGPTQPMTVSFNMAMDRPSTEAAISLRPAAPLNFAWSNNDRVVTITPKQGLTLQTQYTLTVDNTATSAAGRIPLDDSTSTVFNTVRFPAILHTYPANNQQTEPYQYGVSFEFVSPMNPETIEGRVQISPEPEEEPSYYYDSANPRFFSISFELVRNTQYVITIPGDAADPYGNTLGADFTWRFTTSPLQAILSFNLPFYLSQVTTDYPTNVGVIYRNVSAINAALYDAGLPLATLANQYDINNYFSGELLRQWSLPPSASLDEAKSLTIALADGASLPTGVYFLTLSAPEIDPQYTQYWQNQRQMLIVADTNLVVKEMPDEVHVWATDLATGLPAPGRSLTLYTYNGNQIGTAISDNNGFASFDYSYPQDYWQGVIVVSNAPRQSGFGISGSNWAGELTFWNSGLNYNPAPGEPEFVYLYSDRPIYRPGDTVYFRGILRTSDYGRYGLPGRETVPVSINSLNYYGGDATSFSQDLELSLEANGTFSGQVTLPDDLLLGSYQIYLNTGTSITNNYLNFTVAEYRKPEFQVTVTPLKSEAMRGETVDVVVDAGYFFGGAATDLDVYWTAYANSYTLPWTGTPYYNFSDQDNFFYNYNYSDSFYGSYLLSGNGKTNSDGQLVITLPADLLDTYRGSQQINIEASVTDLNGLPVTNRASVVLHAAQTYVGINNAEYIAVAGQETAINLITVDWAAQAVANQNVEVVFYQREYHLERDARFGSYINNWLPIDSEVGRLETTTDGNGLAQVHFSPPQGGTYRVVATVTDPAGRTHSSSTFLWATTTDFAGWRNNDHDRRMELTPDKSEYEVGDVAHVLVQSPFSGPVQAWLTIERGNLIEQRLITLQTNSDLLDIPVTADYAPNVFVSVVAVKGIDETNAYADIRLGVIELPVKPAQLQLNLSLLPRETTFTPGEVATYDIEVTDYAGNPVSADLSLALVDLAVLTLQPDNSPEISSAFYYRQPLRSFIGSGLFISGEGRDIEVPLEQLGLGGGGGGGDAGLRSVALADDENVRRDFPDTAFWRASLTTDASGRATIEIPLPDSLTTWRLSSKAVTADSLVGQTSVDVVVSLPLLLRPVTPRFFTVGDVALVGAIVNNNSQAAIEATVSLEAAGLTLAAEANQVVTVPAGGQQLVRWQVTVQDVSNVDLTFRVSGGGFSDATKPNFGFGPNNFIPVYRYDAQDLVGTSGIVEDPGRSVEAVLLPSAIDLSQGSVDLTLSPSLAAAMFETLDYIDTLDYDANCAHAIAHQLLPNVAAARAFSTLNLNNPQQNQFDSLVTAGIARLATLQKASGGWGWCYSETSDAYLTAYVLFSLAKAEQAGYDVSAVDLNTAIRTQLIITINRVTSPYLANRMAWFLYVRSEWGQANLENIDQLFNDHRELLDPYSQALLALAYELSGGSGNPNQQTLLATLGSSAILSATGAHWEDSIQDYANFNSDVRGTAIVLDALARLDPDNGLAAQAVRWLMVNRSGSHWYTNYETTWSVLALTDWMVATGELNANFGYQVNINGVAAVSGTFDQSNLMTPLQFSEPLNQLLATDVNFFDFQHLAGDGRLYYTAHLNSWLPADTVEAVSRGLTIQRIYYDAACTANCQPIGQIAAGQQVRVVLSIIAPHNLSYVIVEDGIPAGTEAIDPTLDTSAYGFNPDVEQTEGDYFNGYWGWWFFDRIEYRDEKVVFYSSSLPAGTYQYTYYLQAYLPGTFQVVPTIAREEFFPEVFGRSDGMIFIVTE